MRTRAKNLYSMRAALTWMHQVASALAALHAQQPPYIMGDVKPDNVFLTDGHINGAVAKLGDLKPHRWAGWPASCLLWQHTVSLQLRWGTCMTTQYGCQLQWMCGCRLQWSLPAVQ
jgi:serine/threonine protein kinase